MTDEINDNVVDIHAERRLRAMTIDTLTPEEALRVVSLWIEQGLIKPSQLVIALVTEEENESTPQHIVWGGAVDHQLLMVLVDAVTALNMSLQGIVLEGETT